MKNKCKRKINNMSEKIIREVFEKCQTGIRCQSRLHTALWKLHSTMPFPEFWKSFEHHLKYSMIVLNAEPAVERTLDFVVRFVTSSPPTPAASPGEHSVLKALFNFLLENHDVSGKAVRFRCCYLINKLLSNLGDDAEIDNHLYDRIHECMLERLRDRVPAVKTQAVFALSRLQDPTDENCPVIRAYMFLISRDPNSDVRRAVVMSLVPSIKSLPALIGRTHDSSDKVRQLAYVVLGEKVSIKALSIAQRIQLLRDGLNDRAPSVKKSCQSKLLQKWLTSVEGNVLELLKNLDVESSTETCQQVLDTLFETFTAADLISSFDLLNDDKLIPEDKLTCETAMYWRALCENLQSRGVEFEEYLDQILPNCVTFCHYMYTFLKKLSSNYDDLMTRMELEFIAQELLILMKCFDMTDEASRKEEDKLLHHMLVSEFVSPRLVQHIIPLLHNIKTNTESLIGYLTETISEITQPFTTVETHRSQEEIRQIENKIAQIRVKVNQAREELEECVRNQEFEQAAELKQTVTELNAEKAMLLESAEPQTEEIRAEKDDAVAVHKCLTIIYEMLHQIPVKTLSPTLEMLLESQIVPGLQNKLADIRNVAIGALGLCCLLKQDIIMQYLPLLMLVSQVDREDVRVSAVRVMFDIIHYFGFGIIKGDNISTSAPAGGKENDAEEKETDSDATGHSESKAAVELLDFLSAFLDSDSSELCATAAEGMAKLFLSGRVKSCKLISQLLILWYNPDTKDNSYLRQCLGTFFPLFAFASRSNQELFEETFIETLNTILEAPTPSPLLEINTQNVSEFLIHLINTRLLIANKNSQITNNPGHDSIAVKVCNEILTNTHSFGLSLWTWVLNRLDISCDETHLTQLKALCEKILHVVKVKRSHKAVEKFHNTVINLLAKSAKTKPTEKTNIDDSDMEDNVFNSPKPIHHSGKPVHDNDIENTRKGLENLLLDSEQDNLAARKSLTPK